MDNEKPGRFGYVHILRRLSEFHRGAVEAARESEGSAGGGGLQFDRRQVLLLLCQAFEAEEAVLLRRGFDRAYRGIVEGV